MRLLQVGALFSALVFMHPAVAQPAAEPELRAYDELVRLEEVGAELASQRANDELAAPAFGPYFETEACPSEPVPAVKYPTVTDPSFGNSDTNTVVLRGQVNF